MEKWLLFSLLFLVHQATATNVIYKLSKEEYSRMPPKNNLDRFTHCLNQPHGVYCTAHADVIADGPSELLDMMRGYSAHTAAHFNYTQLQYGLCFTKTCQAFYNGSRDEADLRTTAEACLNHSLSAEYGLKARVTELNCYFEDKSKFDKDWFDWLVALLMLSIFALNVVGTVYDVNRDPAEPENSYLTAFSLRANWRQLVAPPPSDPRVVRLRCINRLKAIISFIVILGHIPMPLLAAVDNPTWIEKANDIFAYHMLAQGHLITLTFFVISGFLLTYNAQIQSEKAKITWQKVPKAVMNRLLRLTPVNVVSLLLTATWMRFTPSAPLWHEMIGEEVQDCRKYWFYNLFYVSNMQDHSQCILQTWYLACDVHLFTIGMLVVTLAPTPKARWWALGALYTIGFAWPAYNIYSLDLHATLQANPTAISEFFIKDPTFNNVFKRTHGNLPMFVMGMAFGYLVYDWQKRNVFEKDLTKYRFIYWALVPIALLIIPTSGVLYMGDAPRASMAGRLWFAPVIKPLFLSVMILVMLGAMFRVENGQRGFLEWDGWMPLSRISYCIFSFHMHVVRYIGGTRTTLVHHSLAHWVLEYAGVTIISLQVALFFYLFVEAPFGQLVKVAMTPAKTAANRTSVKDAAINSTAVKDTAINSTAVKDTAIDSTAVKDTVVNDTTVDDTALNGSNTALKDYELTEQVTTEAKDKYV